MRMPKDCNGWALLVKGIKTCSMLDPSGTIDLDLKQWRSSHFHVYSPDMLSGKFVLVVHSHVPVSQS